MQGLSRKEIVDNCKQNELFRNTNGEQGKPIEPSLFMEKEISSMIFPSLHGLHSVFAQNSIFRNVVFDNTDFYNVNFSLSTFYNCIFRNCNLRKSELIESNFSNVIFDKCDLSKSVFMGTFNIVVFNSCLMNQSSITDSKINTLILTQIKDIPTLEDNLGDILIE